MLLRWLRGMWRWLLVRMLCRPGLRLSRRGMCRWMLLVGLRVRRMVWLRMLRLLVMLLVVRRCRRGLLTLVLLLLGCLLARLRRALRLLG